MGSDLRRRLLLIALTAAALTAGVAFCWLVARVAWSGL